MTDEEREARNLLRRQVGARLRAVREIMGLAQGEFGRRAGIQPNAYHQIEVGDTLPSVESAIALRNAHGLTLDYIYCGDTGDLSAPIRRALDALEVVRRAPSDDK